MLSKLIEVVFDTVSIVMDEYVTRVMDEYVARENG